jgi:hypothetical protein
MAPSYFLRLEPALTATSMTSHHRRVSREEGHLLDRRLHSLQVLRTSLWIPKPPISCLLLRRKCIFILGIYFADHPVGMVSNRLLHQKAMSKMERLKMPRKPRNSPKAFRLIPRRKISGRKRRVRVDLGLRMLDKQDSPLQCHSILTTFQTLARNLCRQINQAHRQLHLPLQHGRLIIGARHRSCPHLLLNTIYLAGLKVNFLENVFHTVLVNVLLTIKAIVTVATHTKAD